MPTRIRKLAEGWEVNGVHVFEEDYLQKLQDEQDIKNFEHHLLKVKGGRRIYTSFYPDRVNI